MEKGGWEMSNVVFIVSSFVRFFALMNGLKVKEIKNVINTQGCEKHLMQALNQFH